MQGHVVIVYKIKLDKKLKILIFWKMIKKIKRKFVYFIYKKINTFIVKIQYNLVSRTRLILTVSVPFKAF